MSDPIEDMQVKMAFLEKNLMDLDGVVRELYDRIEGLERDLASVRSTVEEQQLEGGLAANKPPHY